MSLKAINTSHSWTDFVAQMQPLNQKLRGNAFELLAELYLQIDPIYASKLKHVWHEKNLPAKVRNKLGLPTQDIGVDLVAESKEGEYWAIQCKYHHDPHKNLTKNELNSFIDLATRICKGKFSTLLVVSSAYNYSIHLQKHAAEVQYCLGDQFEILDADFFRQARALIKHQTPKLKKRSPRPHQKTAIKNAVKHFIDDGESRGKLVHPCGTGKSLIGYWIAEELGSKMSIVALPSLYLVRQILADWTKESLATGRELDWMVVCSESTIGESGDPAMRFQEVGVDVTTDVNRIVTFLRKRGKGHKVIFTTYQSGEVTAKAARKAKRVFDVAIFDEAHRTVGQSDSMFAQLIDEKNIRIKKRVFMTATERRYQGSSETILSMDDVDAYGETFDLIAFKDALEQKTPILCDYKIVTMVVARSEVQEMIDDNFLVKPDKGKWDDDTEARTLAAMIALRKVMKKHRAKHALTFHNSIAKAEAFKKSQEKFNGAVKGYGHADCFHVSSKVSTGERRAELERFKTADRAIITNAKCLTEGVDVPTIDAVLFADTKRSTVDIVQAAGRALRHAEGKDMGYIIVPVLVDDNDPDAADKAFQDILMTLRAMASNDDRIIDYFRSVSQGKRPKGGKEIVEIDIPDAVNINLEDFTRNIETQVWHRLAKISWRPFEEAREFASALGLRSYKEWAEFNKKRGLPADIPVAADQLYGDKGWVSWGDWLGTGTVSSHNRQYKSFDEARKFVRSLGISSVSEWRFLCQGKLPRIKRKLPMDIPTRPARVYKDKGWESWGDWLGSGKVSDNLREYRSFADARKFALGLSLQSRAEWTLFCQGKLPKIKQKLPDDMSASPWKTYKDKGWKGMGDWLGTGIVATQHRVYLPFGEARKFVRRLSLKNEGEWRLFRKGKLPRIKKKLPEDIPANPNSTYKDEGWKGFGDWLGTGYIANRKRVYRPFIAARKFARGLGLKNGKEWSLFCRGELPVTKQKLPEDIPVAAERIYKSEGWKGMGDWLGTGNIATRHRDYLSYNEARKFARSLRLQSAAEWKLFCKDELKGIKKKFPSDIPKTPQNKYKDKGWIDWYDWLGNPGPK